MPTLIRNTTREQDARNKMIMDTKLDSTWNTGTMTPTSNREEVSWSSSDGSTYYSEGRPSLEQQSSEESTEDSEDEASLQQRRQTRKDFVQEHRYDTDSYSSKSYDASDYYERSKERKERIDGFRPRRGQRELHAMEQKRKKNLRLKDVDTFSAIESATGSEDVSEVGFLTTADTAEVFCKAGIPFEITANKKLYEKVSAVSSTSSSDSSSQSSYSSRSESDEESRNYREKDEMHEGSDTGRATIRSQNCSQSRKKSSLQAIARHKVALVSASYEETVSSLECTSSLDELSLGSDTSASSSVGKKRTQTRRKSPGRRKEVAIPRKSTRQRREKVARKECPIREKEVGTSYQLDSKASRMKEMQRKKSDLKTDEKIRKLKEKIRRISDLSNTNIAEHDYEGDDDNLETGEPSILRFDTSARPFAEGDIEEGHLRTSVSKSQKKRTSLESINEMRNSMSEHTKVVITGIQYRAIAAYDHLMPIIARKRAEFLRKPRYEQVLIIAIASLFSLFLVLLFVMIAQ